MSAARGKPSDCELHGVIHFLYLEGVPMREIYRQLCARYEEKNGYKIWNVYYWVEQFAKGQTMMNSLEWLKNFLQNRTVHGMPQSGHLD